VIGGNDGNSLPLPWGRKGGKEESYWEVPVDKGEDLQGKKGSTCNEVNQRKKKDSLSLGTASLTVKGLFKKALSRHNEVEKI